MNTKSDPYATKLHKRIDALLLLFIVVVIALLLRPIAKGKPELSGAVSSVRQPFWSTLAIFTSKADVNSVAALGAQYQFDLSDESAFNAVALAGASSEPETKFSPLIAVENRKPRHAVAVNLDQGQGARSVSAPSSLPIQTQITGVGTTVLNAEGPALANGYSLAGTDARENSSSLNNAIETAPRYAGEAGADPFTASASNGILQNSQGIADTLHAESVPTYAASTSSSSNPFADKSQTGSFVSKGISIGAPDQITSNTWNGGGGGSFLWSNTANWSGAAPIYGTISFSGTTGLTNTLDGNFTSGGNADMNQVNWNGTGAWVMNNSNSTVLRLFDNGGTQSKLESLGTGGVTINAPITFASTVATNPWGEINAVSSSMTFGSGSVLTVNGSGVNGIRMFGGSGAISTTFNGTVSASGKYFATTNANQTINIGGAFSSGDFYLMNSGTLKITSAAASFTTSGITALRLGGDFGTTGSQNLTLGATFQLTPLTGGVTVNALFNTVASNTSNALLIDSLNTSGTNTMAGDFYLDSDLKVQQAAGGTLVLSDTTLDLKNQTMTVLGNGTVSLSGVVGNSTGSGKLVLGTNGTVSTGTLKLSSTNTYTGDTTIRAGTLDFATAAARSDSSAIRLGSTSGASVDASINLSLATGGLTIGSVINPVTTSGSGTLSLNSQNTSGTNTYSGHLGLDRSFTITQSAGGTLNATSVHTTADTLNVLGLDIKGFTLTLTPAAGGTITISGASGTSANIYNSTGTGSVLMNGAGTLNLSGSNTYSGTTTISSGTLNLGNATALGAATTAKVSMGGGTLNLGGNSVTLIDLTGAGGTINTASGTPTLTVNRGAGSSTFSGNIVNGAGTLALTKSGTGTLILAGSDTYSGATSISAGILQAGSTSGFSANSDITFTAGSTRLVLGGFSNTIGAINGTAGVVENASVTAATLTLGNTGANGNFTSIFQDGTGGGALAVIKNGAGAQAAGSSTFTGGLTINNGTWQLGSINGFGNGAVVINGGAVSSNNTNARVLVNAANTLAINASFTLGDATNTGALTLPGAVTLTGTPTITVPTGNSHILSGNIGGSSGLTKAGAGTLTLSGTSNSFSGAYTANGGVTNLNANGSLASVSSVVVNTGATVQTNVTGLTNAINDTASVTLSGTGNFDLRGGSETIGSIASGSTTSTLQIGQISSVTGSITVGDATSTSFSGIISGSRVTPGGTIFTKQGSGILTLAGTNTYSDVTAITVGGITLTNSAGLGAVGANNGTTVSAGAVLALDGTGGALTVGNELLTLNGTGISTGGALRNIAGANVYQGTVTLATASRINSDAGSLTFNTAANSITATNQNLTLGGASNGTVSGTITIGSGTLTKDGAGTWTLSGANTYTGVTTVSAGTLAEGSTGSIADTSNLTVNGATAIFDLGSNHSDTVGTVTLQGGGSITGSGTATLTANTGQTFEMQSGSVSAILGGSGIALNKTTSGTVTLNGANTYTGATTLTAGTLILGNKQAFGVGGTVAMNGVSISANTDLSSANAIANTVTLGGNNTFTGTNNIELSGTVTETTSAFIINNISGATLTLSNTLALSNTASNFTLTINGSGNTTLSGAITNGTGGATGPQLNYGGSGILTLSGTSANTFGGNLNVTSGEVDLNKTAGVNAIAGNILISGASGPTLKLLAANQIANTSDLTINTTGIFDLNGNAETIDALIAVNSNTSVTLGSGTLTVGANNQATASFAGVISGTGGSLIKTGSGTQTLTGTNTFNGGTTISGGTLALGNATNTLANAGAVNVGNGIGGTLDLLTNSDTIGALTLNIGVVQSTGSGGALTTSGVTVTGSGNTISSGATVNGAITQNASSALTVNGTGGNDSLANLATLAGTGTVGTVTLAGNNTLSSTGTLTTAGITVNNSGNLLSSGTVSGAITQNAGSALTVNGTGGSDSLAAGATSLTGSGTVGAVTLNGSGNTISGTGTLTTGGLTVNGTNNTLSSGTVLGAITQNASSALTVNGTGGSDAMANLATLNGTGTVGVVTLAGNNTLSSSSTLATGGITVNGTGNSISGGTVSGAITQNASSALAVNGTGGNDAMASGATLSGIGTVGTISLAGNNTISSTGTLTTGLLTVSGTGNSITTGTVTGGANINSSAFLTVNGTLGGTTNVAGTLAGSGSVGILNINSGGTLSPGNSPGTIASGNTAYNGGGSYLWQINNASGTKGVDPGWDWNNITGTLTIGASVGNEFTINVTSLTLLNTSGAAANFNKYGAYNWEIATASGGISGFAANKFILALGNFLNDYTGTLTNGSFSITTVGNDLVLQYTAAADAAPAAAYWTGNASAGGSVWNTNVAGDTNWATDAAGATDTHAIPGTTSNLFFTANSATNLSNTLGQDFTINSLNFTGTGTSATAGVTIGGNTLTINATNANGNTAGSGITVASGSGADTINSNVALGATQTWTNNSANALTVAGVVSGTGFGLTTAGTGTIIFSGSSANTYNGLTTVSAGELDLNKSSGVAVAGDLTVAGGIAKLLASNQIATSSNLLVSSGTFALQGFNNTLAGVQLTGGAITGTGGTLTSASNFDVRAGSVSAKLAGSVGLDKTTAGTVTLSGVNSYSGTTVSAGTLQLAGSGTLGSTSGGLTVNSGTLDLNGTSQTVGAFNGNSSGLIKSSTGSSSLTVGNGGGSGSFAGQISNIGTIALTKTGSGTETLTGNNSYTGATVINNGILELARSGGPALTGTSGVTVNTGGTLLLSGNNQLNQAVPPAITLAGGDLDAGGFTQGTAGNPLVPNTGLIGMGALTMTSSSIIDMTGTSVLHFTASNANTWTGTLSIYDWTGTPITGGGLEQILFGGDVTGLTATQLTQVSFYSDSGSTLLSSYATILLDGEIVPGVMTPVPEPSTWVAGALALLAVGYTQRRRFAKKLIVAS